MESPRKERIASLIPKTLDEVNSLFDLAVDISRKFDKLSNPLTFALAKGNINSRDTTWIVSNGHCLDNIYISKSSLPFAGFGAISKRLMRSGNIIAPMPLLHISDQNFLATYKTHVNGQIIAHDLNEKVTHQLLLNYCFGHNSSTILLCPITNAIFANNCGNDNTRCSPNAKFQWSNNTTTKQWLRKDIDDISEQNTWALSFDLIATKDIQPGEEVSS